MARKTPIKQPTKEQEEKNYEEEVYQRDNLIYDPDQINIITREITIKELLRKIGEKFIDLASDFPGYTDIWNDEVKSRFIESIIIRIPLPAFYVDGTNEKQWLVVDGLQRLSALKQFINDKTLCLTGLEYLDIELDGKTYQELDRKYQRRIEETQVTVNLIAPGTPTKVKYNIFKRINTGGGLLNLQEIRYALNPGKALKLLAEIAKSPEFTNVIQISETKIKRMEDREFVLGALAVMLTPTSYKDYAKDKREEFLDNAIKTINSLSDYEMKQLAKKFKKTMFDYQKIFANQTVSQSKRTSRFSRDKTLSQSKTLTLFFSNKALFETCIFHISQLNIQEIQKLKIRKQDLINKFTEYLDKDKEFAKSISQAQDKIEYRFETIEKIIRAVIND
ncbi:MAG: DUF262 domain-containing protein [Okeania sp. SIO3I5]|uniref:DUF262 domain-containing protein n=1 Tax=Okeania sp. SIO3I5 TaxID=2607805 RepID=UPI0013BC19CA|nr:DUF262 domain-containing protein [Okeania sp. SIO3I5]NEQ41441.1 DUF262 domain-containing protein [Okeania sp. SIO3I5]